MALKPKPTRSFPEFFAHLKGLGFNPQTCIDVGAAGGTPTIYQAFPEALHIAFEPLPDFHDQLAATLKPYRHEIHHCALMEAPGSQELLRMPSNIHGSSMMHRHARGENLVTVEVRRLEEILDASAPEGPFLLKTDCQGADLLVIKGLGARLAEMDVIIMETSFFRFWGEHQPDFADVVAHMRESGFAVYDLLDGLYRPSDNALGQVDVAFVREDGGLRENLKW